jgi:EPS-associated MarR family transcriptional regulator
MIEHSLEKDILDILRILSSKEDMTQRDLSNHLGISLGKTNYLLKELVKAGLLEIRNFITRDHKMQKVRYHLTKEGFEERVRLTLHFMREKEAEYNAIKKEWERLSNTTKVPLEVKR